ncbi:hypothetical protein ACHAWT_000780 [Skeletonema menzelii]
MSSRHDNGGHQQPYYHRYNHYPQRSSFSYSSRNLSSYNKSNSGLPLSTSSQRVSYKSPLISSSTPSTVTSSSSSPSNSSSSPQQSSSSLSHQEDDFSVIEESSNSAISLYEVFATGIPSNRSLQHDQLDKRNDSSPPLPYGGHSVASLSMNNDDIMTSSRYFTTNESLEREDDNDNNGDDDERAENLNINASSSVQQVQQQHKDDNNDKDKDSVHHPLHYLLTKYRKRLKALIVSLTAIWIYSQLRKSKRRSRQRRQLKDSTKNGTIFDHSRGMDVIQYLLRIISIPVSGIVQRLTQQQIRSSTTKTQVPKVRTWEDAISTPLSHLLALAESGTISKVKVRGSILTYLHTIPSSSSPNQNSTLSEQQQQQRWSKTTLPSQNPTIINQIISTLLQKGCHDIVTVPESLWARFWNGPAIVALPFAYLAGLYWIMRLLQQQQLEDGNDGNATSISNNTATTFADVAGLNSSLQELSDVVSFLRHPNEFHSIGASPPRGILLHGPPGTGKTLLARAIAGEITRNQTDQSTPLSSTTAFTKFGQNSIDAFVVCSGSDFVETYVGRGAARVRAMFRKAREGALTNFQRRQRVKRTLRRFHSDMNITSPERNNTNVLLRAVSDVGGRIVGAWEGIQTLVNPEGHSSRDKGNIHDTPLAIIFIDEIDALAKQRDSGSGISSLGGNDEREQTLNQLLIELDGFNSGGPTDSVTVIVIAATNRPNVLDPAILRSGRFDRHVAVHLPDCQGREDILRLHAQRIRLDSSAVNFHAIAEMTPQFSGADLKCLINEAALLAVRSGSKLVAQEHLVQAARKVKKSSRSGGRYLGGASLY